MINFKQSEKEMNNAVDILSNKYGAVIEDQAKQLMNKYKSLCAFSAAMGMVCFYDKTGNSIDDDKLPVQVQEFVRFVYNYQDIFGSPGIQI